jgi:uncharacterized protein YecE (DUF72 family)
MKERLRRLAERDIYIGTSSWKYPGWKGFVYLRPYRSEKAFNETCLEEYAETFSTVGVDHTYYAWPTAKGFEKYVSQVPDTFRFGLKVTEELTVWRYPKLSRYGKRAGTENEHFLDAGLFAEKFLEPLRPFASQVGPLMLEFSQFHPGMISSGAEFVARLDRFFTDLKSEREFQFAIEIRNANWLKAPYFECLAKHGVSHVFNSWTKMPTLDEQRKAAEPFDLPSFVSRVLLQPGTKYQEAVEAFAPYDKICEAQPALREAAAAIVVQAVRMGKPAFVFVNNRAEGSAPLTIAAILDIVDREGKK